MATVKKFLIRFSLTKRKTGKVVSLISPIEADDKESAVRKFGKTPVEIDKDSGLPKFSHLEIHSVEEDEPEFPIHFLV